MPVYRIAQAELPHQIPSSIKGVFSSASGLGSPKEITESFLEAAEVAEAQGLPVIPLLGAETHAHYVRLGVLNAVNPIAGIVTFGGRKGSDHINTSHLTTQARALEIPLITLRPPIRQRAWNGAPTEAWVRSKPFAAFHAKLGSVGLISVLGGKPVAASVRLKNNH